MMTAVWCVRGYVVLLRRAAAAAAAAALREKSLMSGREDV